MVAFLSSGRTFGFALLSRVLGFGGLLLGEYLLISFLFDARALMAGGGPLSALAYLGDVATVGMVASAAVLAWMGPSLRRALLALPQAGVRTIPWAVLIAHGAIYAVFVGLTGHLFGSGGAASGRALLAWLVAGAALFATWLPLVMPLAALRALWPQLSSALLAGAVVGLLAFGAGKASALIWPQVAPFTLGVVAALLRYMVPTVIVDASTATIGTPDFLVNVAPVCSGFEGIGLILIFLGGFIAIERKTLVFPRVLLLLPIAVASVWIANTLRIAMLITVGTRISPAIALGGFHSKAGWLLFCAIALGFIALARHASYFSAERPGAAEAAEPNRVAAYLMPELALIATALLAGLFSAGFDYGYPLRVVVAAGLIWAYRGRYRELRWGVHWESVAIGVAVFGIWHLLASGATAPATDRFEQALAQLGQAGSAAWLAARVLGTALVVPFAEELAFRAYLLRRCASEDFEAVDARKFALVPWLVSSLAFGLLHTDWLAATLAGLAYAFAQQRRGRVTDAVIAHGVTNLLLALEAMALGHWHWLA